jgi:signal transduction histidine kinase
MANPEYPRAKRISPGVLDYGDTRMVLLESLFDRMPIGIAIFDRAYRIQHYNPIWKEFSERCAPPSASPLAPGVFYFDHLPGLEPIMIPLFERVLAGENIRQDGLRIETGGSASYWDVVLAPTMENNEVNGILNVTIDVTERVLHQHNLEQRAVKRTRELQMLLDVAGAANRSLDLDETLKTTLDLLVDLSDATRAGVMLPSETSGKLETRMLRPEQAISPVELAQIIQACEAVVASREPLYVMPEFEQGFIAPGALLPLQVRDRTLGVLIILGAEGEQFGSEQLALFKSIAEQLGVAVENARLYERAEQEAVATERNRLARDLHDAVTQTLFSASLIADVLPKIWERNPETGKQKLEDLKILTRGALSEMRTLLLELRPAALIEMDLGDLIRHLANAFTGRSRIPVVFTLDGQLDPKPDVKEAFYHITQEALNNINKHAGASEVSIHLIRRREKMEMFIRDNGRGFDPQFVSPENLGLGIMRERADAIGAQLDIHSQVGAGTRIELKWKDGDQ